MRPRYPELDWLRTAAIIGMVLYHGAYDLDALYGWELHVDDGLWKLLQRCTAILFLLLVGMSYAASSAGRTAQEMRARSLRRFLLIGGCAAMVSAGTWLADGETYVRFGILHLIAVSSLLLPLLSPLRERAGAVGVLILLAASLLPDRAGTAWLLPLGVMPEGFRSVDWFPLIPWFGVILLGYAAGCVLYVRGLRGTPGYSPRWLHVISWPGRYALLIYLLHQPLLLALCWLTLGRPAF